MKFLKKIKSIIENLFSYKGGTEHFIEANTIENRKTEMFLKHYNYYPQTF